MIVSLFAAGVLHQNLMWTPIQYIDMADIHRNQFRMENPSFAGIDTNGNPFSVRAQSARQEYDNEYVIFLNTVTARIVRVDGDIKITDDITANYGKINRADNTVTLKGNVKIDSDNGDSLRANEVVVKL